MYKGGVIKIEIEKGGAIKIEIEKGGASIESLRSTAIRGLAFRGTEEGFGSPYNGNFMGALELLAEFDPFIQILETNGLLLDNGGGQSFDNAANMSGRYNDVQAVPKEKNKFANYVPCTAHSLNLVGAE
ncbi:zinc finger MYM-type protein 1 [Trichonephila clavipes]|nr:zinc finger MYM-type protein 1 [Trichonephila clavipes]